MSVMQISTPQQINVRQANYSSLKKSGSALISELLQHWNTKPIKYCYEVRLGKMLQNEPSTINDTLEPYLRSANVTWKGIDLSDIKEMWISPKEKLYYKLKNGDLVVCEGGDVGRVAVWKDEIESCYIQNAVHIVRGKSGNSNKYLYYWMYTLKK
jgi:type I restriction enzyme S subunit